MDERPAYRTDPGPAATSPTGDAAKTPARILVIDDEPAIRRAIALMLETMGHQPIEADGGEAGLERFRAEHDQLDLVLLDRLMPGVDGRDCFIAMQQLAPAVPVVLCTGYTDPDDLNDLSQRGLKEVLRKPYGWDELEAVVTRHVRRR